tara:strand:+ start:1037 stop:3202 length:2166 start_codon:yes stop_codon:yes gene_type:complete
VAVSNVKLRVDARDAVSALNQTNNASKQLNQTLNTTSRRAGTATANIQRFGISFRSVVGPMVALTGALTLANRSLSTFGKRQADLQVLAAQLERIGAGGSKQLNELRAAADRLGDATLFSQDDFIQSFNILSSFRAIAVESFTEVSEVAADIAQVMGSDVKSATVQLAKALEDPKRGLTALSRSGITFNEVQTETIKKLVDSGKQLDAQALILETIKGQYEGAGTAAGKGFAGALDLLSENAADAAEALGEGLEPAATGAATALAGVFEQISKIPAPAGQAALQIGLITAGVVALKKAVDAFIATKLAGVIAAQIAMYKAFGAQIYIAAAAQGALNIALGIGKALMVGLPVLAVAGGIVGIADALNQAINGQKDFNKLLKDGTVEMLENALATKQSSLALQERMMLQGRMEGRAADTSRLDRLKGEVAELEAALVKRRAEKPKAKPKTKPGGGDTVIDDKELKRLAQIAAASADRVRSLEQQTLLASALNDEEKRQFERQIEIANLLENREGLNKTQLQDQLEALTNLYQQEDATRAIIQAQEDRKRKEREVADAAKAALEAQQRETQRLQSLFGGIGQTISDGIVGALTGAQSAAQALGDTLRNVGKQLLQLGINTLLYSAFPGGGLFSGLPRFANGGRPPLGRPSIVGERGPELFVPSRAGTIVPNHAMGGANVTVNVDASGSSVQGNGPNASQLGKAIGAAVQAELIKQKRPGGLLTR